jgi:hypothetical protein
LRLGKNGNVRSWEARGNRQQAKQVLKVLQHRRRLLVLVLVLVCKVLVRTVLVRTRLQADVLIRSVNDVAAQCGRQGRRTKLVLRES